VLFTFSNALEYDPAFDYEVVFKQTKEPLGIQFKPFSKGD
jgi:hypothetical protein